MRLSFTDSTPKNEGTGLRSYSGAAGSDSVGRNKRIEGGPQRTRVAPVAPKR